MTDAKFFAVRTYLGFTAEEMAECLEVDLQELQDWENAHVPIPEWAAHALDQLVKDTEGAVAYLVADNARLVEWRALGDPFGPTIDLPQTLADREMWEDEIVMRKPMPLGRMLLPVRACGRTWTEPLLRVARRRAGRLA